MSIFYLFFTYYMFSEFEKFAEKIVDFMYTNRKKTKNSTNISLTSPLTREEIDNVFYEIIPYKYNDFSLKEFSKLLKNFSYFSDRINFYVNGNSQKISLIISFPSILENKFITRFYNYFPSSKLVKLDQLNIDIDKANYDTFFYTIGDDLLLPSSNNFFTDTLYLFKDIPFSEKVILRYSLIMNSTGEVEYDSLFEIVWKGIKLFFYGIYYFFCRLFIGSKPKKKILTKRQELKTGISGTALSIGIAGNKGFSSLYFNLLSSNLNVDLYKDNKEIFSHTNIESLPIFFHVPLKKELLDTIKYIPYKRLAPPSNLPSLEDDITILGNADWADEKQVVGLKQEDKSRHVYIVGKTGVGKSTLLSNMILSDLDKGRGLALIDPHGDLVNTILSVIPETRKDDLVIFDVSNVDNPVGFNFFEKTTNYNKDLSVSTILSIFKKLYGHSWGPRLEYIFRNVLLALSDYEEANFLHIMKMLTDKDFRKKVLLYVKDPVIKDFWEKEFGKRSERFASEAISPIMNKVGQFVSSPIIRNIFGQKKSTINISDIMQNNKILLVNLSKGLIGEDNSSMIGSFIVSSIQVETMKRANLALKDRKDFSLYIDEFQNFATDSFAVILSEARKYKLSLILANQYISQIDESIQNAIFGNIGNIIVFNSGNADAEILAKQFKNQVTSNDITSIPKFKSYVKLMIDGDSTDVFGLSTYPISEEKYKSKDYINTLINNSIDKYSRKKEDVEKEIENSLKLSNLSKPVLNEENKNIEKNIKPENKDKPYITNSVDNKKSLENDLGDIFEGVVKLKFNYGLFVVAGPYEGLLHKKNISLPEGISWKDYYNIGDKIRVRLLEIKEIDGQKKAVWEAI